MKQKINIVFFSEDNLEMQNWTHFLRSSFQFAAKQINCVTWALCASWKWFTGCHRQKYKNAHRNHKLGQILNVWKEKVNIWYLLAEKLKWHSLYQLCRLHQHPVSNIWPHQTTTTPFLQFFFTFSFKVGCIFFLCKKSLTWFDIFYLVSAMHVCSLRNPCANCNVNTTFIKS